jgi:hypothetical protein
MESLGYLFMVAMIAAVIPLAIIAWQDWFREQ